LLSLRKPALWLTILRVQFCFKDIVGYITLLVFHRPSPKMVSLMFYFGLDENGGSLSDARVALNIEEQTDRNGNGGGARLSGLSGRTDQLGDFRVKFNELEGDVKGHFYTVTER